MRLYTEAVHRQRSSRSHSFRRGCELDKHALAWQSLFAVTQNKATTFTMFQHHDGSSFEGVSMLGIVNALRTGDVVVDMIIAMCLPIILRMVFERLGRLDDIWTWKIWKWLFNGMSREHERFISHSTTHDQWGNRMNSDEDSQNSILLKAIKLYLHKVVKLDLRSTHLDLTELRDANCDIHDDEDDEFQEDEFGNRPHVPTSLASQLTRYTILSSLPKDEWHEIGTFGGGKVSLTIEHNNRTESNGTDQSGSGNNNTNTRSIEDTTFHFSSPTKGSIDCFVNAAYQWYLDELRKAEDNSRYYYEMKIPEVKFGKSSDDNGGSITYKRYRLQTRKASIVYSFLRRNRSSISWTTLGPRLGSTPLRATHISWGYCCMVPLGQARRLSLRLWRNTLDDPSSMFRFRG